MWFFGKSSPSIALQTISLIICCCRLKHLMLYEDEDQLEPSHIFALDSYDVDVYGGMEATREGDLFVKRNSIRLRSKPSTNLTGSEVLNSIKELHFLTDNCAYKEDFYHALIRLQQELPSRTFAATPLTFEPADMARLVQLLHGSEANIQTRWFNVLVGRLFLALYRTPEAEAMIRAKVTRKLARIRTPSFLTAISIGRVDLGNSAPMISNPKLRELTIEGDMTIEMDVTYRGNFQIDVGTTARFDLGRRLGVRETSLMLKGTLKGLKGHILLRTKPPPSNRFWFTFETEPDFDLDIEPVVSTRLITYGPIIRAIESRVRDVIKETMVHPNWDDIPFLETTHKIKRGGLWQQDTTLPSELTDDTEADLATEPTLILPHSNESVVALPVEGATASDLEKAAESSVAVGGASQDEKSLRPITHTNTAPVGHAHMMASGLSARLSPMLTSLRRRPVATQQEVAPPLPARSSTMNISAAPPLPVRTQTTALEAAQRSVAATSGALSLQTNGKEEKESG